MKTLKIKKTMVAAMALMMVIPTSVFAKKAPSTGDLPPQARDRVVEFQVNGKKVNANPDMGKWFISKEGRTFLPIRLFKDVMGYKIETVYDKEPDENTIYVSKSNEGLKNYKEVLYSYKVKGVDPNKNNGIAVTDNSGTDIVYFDKDELPILYGNRLYLPARKTLEYMGEEVQWKSLPDRDIVNVIKK